MLHHLYNILGTIAGRYYNGNVDHHCDCMIYRSVEIYDFCFCSCGLLHDLNQIYHLAEVIYPNVSKDTWKQNKQCDYKPDPTNEAEQKECEEILHEVFGPPEVPTLAELKDDYEANKVAINEFFPNNIKMLERLEIKLQKDIRDRWRYEKYRKK